MAKYELLRQRLQGYEGLVFELPAPACDSQLLRCHEPDYLHRVFHGQMSVAEVRKLGFPWSPQLVERSRRSTGATIAAAYSALEHGAAVNLAGGTHHASSGQAEGFCVFNDCAVAAKDILDKKLAARVLIVDLDVHQGNGTAQICQSDRRIFTFSMHGEKNFPHRKEHSCLDIALPDGCDDACYLDQLHTALAQIDQQFKTDLVIYLAGADPYEGDRLGRLGLTKAGLKERDQRLLQWCGARHLPVAMCMGGGYAPNPQDIVDIHAASVGALLDYWRGWGNQQVEAKMSSNQTTAMQL